MHPSKWKEIVLISHHFETIPTVGEKSSHGRVKRSIRKSSSNGKFSYYLICNLIIIFAFFVIDMW